MFVTTFLTSRSSPKPTIYYSHAYIPGIGGRAFVRIPSDPRKEGKERTVSTSALVSIFDDGFETLNTIYKEIK